MWSLWVLSLLVVSNFSLLFSVPLPLPDIKGATGGTNGTAAHVAESQGWENEYFEWKNVIFCHQEILNYWAKEKGNSVNSCDYLKVDNLCKGWLLWLLAPSTKEPGHATLVLPKLIPVGLPFPSLPWNYCPHICSCLLFWDFRILQDEGTVFLWNVAMC